MDDQQTRKINEAAQQFTEALVESYRTATDRTVSSAQQLNAELTQNFFSGVISNLRTQAEDHREMIRRLANQQQRQQEATRSLAQESANAYMELLDSMFSFYRRSVEEAASSAGEIESSAEEAESDTREYFTNIMRETNRRSAREI
jgi:hypothetical protein